MNNLVVCGLYLLVCRTAPQIDSIQLSFIMGFNKVSLPTGHHKLLTLGWEVTQNNIAWMCGEVLGHCDVPQWDQRSVVACCIFLKATGSSDTVRYLPNHTMSITKRSQS
jgi:hypothetical protein